MKYFSAFFFIIAALTFSGCSEQTEEMSTVRPRLILDIFKLVKQNRHEDAYVQVKKLREIDQTNTLLPVLEEAEKSNGDLEKINNLLRNSGKEKETEALLKELIEKRGSKERALRRTAEKLHDLVRMEELTDIIVSPQPKFDSLKGFRPASRILKDSVEEFVRLSQKWDVPSRIRNKAIRRLADVSRLQKEEKLRSVQSLELFAPGLPEHSYQTMMALSIYAEQQGTKRK